MYGAIFLTTPASIFHDIDDAHKCARALLSKIKYFCEKNNITDTEVSVGVSNVNPRKAQYVNANFGVGRPQKILAGDLENCFVKAHLHIIVEGKNKELISNIIIKYFIKRYKSIKNQKFGVRIWKKYILKNEVERVKKYIRIQSVHFLTYKSNRKESNNVSEAINATKCSINTKVTSRNQIKIHPQGNCNKNYVILCNLRSQWLLIQELKKTAFYIVNYSLLDSLCEHQKKIKIYGDMINANVDVASLYSNDIEKITIKSERLRQFTNKQKQEYIDRVEQPIYQY